MYEPPPDSVETEPLPAGADAPPFLLEDSDFFAIFSFPSGRPPGPLIPGLYCAPLESA